MEIITYVTKGAITHRDSLGNEGRTEAGDVQVMSAGTGIAHSEFNLEDEETRLFQIWIIPDRRGHAPSWGARPFPKDSREGKFVPLASGIAGDTDVLTINANARVLGATVKAGETVRYELSEDRHAYLVPAKGKIRIAEIEANARDGVAITGVTEIVITALEDAELVLVDAA
jgi:redox-sensitive bicupin YhaK (pirin superfamily)